MSSFLLPQDTATALSTKVLDWLDPVWPSLFPVLHKKPPFLEPSCKVLFNIVTFWNVLKENNFKCITYQIIFIQQTCVEHLLCLRLATDRCLFLSSSAERAMMQAVPEGQWNLQLFVHFDFFIQRSPSSLV